MRLDADTEASRWLSQAKGASSSAAHSLGDVHDDLGDLDSRPTKVHIAAPSLQSTVERDAAMTMRADAQLQEAHEDDLHLASEAARIRPALMIF